MAHKFGAEEEETVLSEIVIQVLYAGILAALGVFFFCQDIEVKILCTHTPHGARSL